MPGTGHSLDVAGGTLRRFFGFSGGANFGDKSAKDLGHNIAGTLQGTRRELMERISAFLIENNLDISPENLLHAHSAFTGANLQLARKILERETANQAITQEWLNLATVAGEPEVNESQKIYQLVSKLEGALESFTHTTRGARSAAANYNTELAKHVEAIDNKQSAVQILASLAELTRAMLERTRLVEGDMKRSEREADSLRKSLAKAQREAQIDHLTGLPNRRAFEALLEANYRSAQEAVEPLSVAFCDIDHFKNVNDNHGHDTGDRVIQATALILSRVSNDKCHVARHGGEEFVLLFRGLTKDEARAKLDEAREQMANRRFINRETDEPIGQITFSGGVANVFEFPNPGAALRAADEALYRAKTEGRNRIEVA